MLDVSSKYMTLRTARAKSRLSLQPATVRMIRDGEVPKGDPLSVAKVAAVQAAKNTAAIIPYCHPVPVEYVGVEFDVQNSEISIEVLVKAVYRTGVEMEAVTAASIAALTIYDMLKMVDDTMAILGIELLEKRGGKNSFRDSYADQLKAAVLVMSDSIAEGSKSDKSGQLIKARLEEEGVGVADYRVVSDDVDEIVAALKQYADDDRLDLVMTTGGTGLSPRDNAPEALAQVIDREIPGINEAARAYGQQRTPFSMLSRGSSGLRGDTLIVCLPGSSKGVAESLDALFPGMLHAFKMIRGFGHDKHGLGVPKE